MDQRFRHRFEKFVGVEKPPTLIVSAFETAEFVASRVQWEYSGDGHQTRFDRADGDMLWPRRPKSRSS